MARPTKHQHEKRTERFNLRLTVAEIEHLREQAQAAGLAPHDYARRRVLGFRVAPAPGQADASLITEINRIGVNVNQLARAVNTGRTFKGDWQAISAELQRVLAKVAAGYGA